MTKTAKRVRSAICTIVSFVMSVCITGTVLFSALAGTALNPSFAAFVAEKSVYAEHLSEELKEEFVSYGNACNIDAAFFDTVIFDTVITPQRIDADTQQQLRGFYTGTVKIADTDDLKTDLVTRLQVYAQDKGFELTDEVNENLSEIAKELCEIYNAYVSVFSMSYFKTVSNMLAKYRPYAWYAAAACAIGFVIAAVIERLYYQKKKNYLRYFIYAFSGAALMVLVAPLAALIGGVGNRINIASASLYALATDMINSVLGAMAASVAVPILCTVVLAVVWRKAKRENR